MKQKNFLYQISKNFFKNVKIVKILNYECLLQNVHYYNNVVKLKRNDKMIKSDGLKNAKQDVQKYK